MDPKVKEGKHLRYSKLLLQKANHWCKKCTNYYCSEHFPSHLDLLPDGDLEYSSTNEGLERYMDDVIDD